MTTILAPERTHGGRFVAADGRSLPLRSTHLQVTAGQGLARTRLVQRFANPHREPLTAQYLLPLPADGAVAAFAFTIGGRRIAGEIERRATARERLEQALAAGHSGGLLQQDRTSLFAQTVGNIPPGAEVVVELTVDQPLSWRAGGEWEFRFPTTVAPRYLGAEGRVPDADRVAVDVADGALPPRLRLDLVIGDRLAGGAAPTSPSHALWCNRGGGGDGERAHVALAPDEGARLDRDVVVRWQVGTPEVGIELGTARPLADAPHGDVGYGVLTLVPPAIATAVVPRDLTVLLDTSGSMSGEPLAQAKAVVAALIHGLTDQDQLQIVGFSNAPRHWRRHAVRATARDRAAALRWLHELQASGGTEMHAAVLASLQSLRDDAQSQVLLVTDGLVGFEDEIVQALLTRLPANCRFHVLGVGPASNRSLTCSVARAGRGVEAIVGLGEDPAAAARRLDARLRAPVVVELRLAGSALRDVAPRQLPDLFAGEPARLSLRLSPAGGTLEVTGRTREGTFACRLDVAPVAAGSGRPEIVTRCGRELVEDLEMRAVAQGRGETVALEAQIEEIGLRFGLATRFTSWIAVSSEPTVDPQAPTRRERIPHELPYGLSAEGLGLRPPHSVFAAGAGVAWRSVCADPCAEAAPMQRAPGAAPAAPQHPAQSRPRKWSKSLFGGWFESARDGADGGAGAGRRTARILWLRDGALAIELAPVGTAWQLPVEALLTFADGSAHVVAVDASRSTRSGAVAAGAVVRLVLQLPIRPGAPDAPAAPPRAVALHGTTFDLTGSL